MHWEEDKLGGEHAVSDTVDAVFDISCRTLPVDHAYALSRAVQGALPWLADEKRAGLHLLHVAGSGNGWVRPDDPQALLYLSRRTKLALRLPRRRVDDASRLVGRTLDVNGHMLHVGKLTERPLSRITTLFSRYVAMPSGADETGFVEAAVRELATLGIQPRKMLCGLATPIATPAQTLLARSIMLANLALEESLLLQEHGLGLERKLGCGVFLPHKDVDDLRRRQG